jgi:hypothetical protein
MPGPPATLTRPCHTRPSAQICRGYAPIAVGGTSGGRTARATTTHITHHEPLRPLGPGADHRREHPPETCGAPVSQRAAWTPATLTHRVPHAAQRADLPRVRPDRRRRDLERQNRAGHHHPYHPPLTFAPTRAGRGPAARTLTGKTCGAPAYSVIPGPPATLTDRVPHAAQRADLPRMGPDGRRQDLGRQNRADIERP